MKNKLVATVDALLPQTQCRECGYPSCKAYAKAMCLQDENIGLCAPGGAATLLKIAETLNQDPAPYQDQVVERYRAPSVAAIIEDECIGCTKCITACPVDAIIGGAKQMHTILESECTGCGLCVAPCPVDCISLIAVTQPKYDKEVARQRFNAQQQRLNEKEPQSPPHSQHDQSKLAFIQAALARNAARKSSS